MIASSRANEPAQTSAASTSASNMTDLNLKTSLWAHELAVPERGSLLLSHPELFTRSQQYFHQAVILLLDHGPQGSYGVMLNRPTQYQLRQVASSVQQLLEHFGDNKLYMGGDVGPTALIVITHNSNVAGADMVANGLYLVRIEDAAKAVASGSASPSDFKFFAQYAGWAPGQLEGECKRGVWFCAASSPAVVFNEELAKSDDDPLGKGYNMMWHHVLQLIGGGSQA